MFMGWVEASTSEERNEQAGCGLPGTMLAPPFLRGGPSARVCYPQGGAEHGCLRGVPYLIVIWVCCASGTLHKPLSDSFYLMLYL